MERVVVVPLTPPVLEQNVTKCVVVQMVNVCPTMPRVFVHMDGMAPNVINHVQKVK